MIASGMEKFPPRLHVLLARNSDVAVIFRRGPSKSVCSILWNRRRDTFEVGQWLRGRIYERRSDLSPDGKHLIYFAMNGRFSSPVRGSWTAISRAPYLKAIALFAKGDCWHGGGLFSGPRKYWINEGYGHVPIQTTTEVQRDPDYRPGPYWGGECPGVYYLRLLRDGWEHKAELSSKTCDVFEKPLLYGLTLRKFAHAQSGAPPGKGCYWDEHEVELGNSAARTDGATWEWADLDARRLVFTEAGCLYESRLSAKGVGEKKLLADFSELKFQAIAAPY
jgi:hypothetical protein